MYQGIETSQVYQVGSYGHCVSVGVLNIHHGRQFSWPYQSPVLSIYQTCIKNIDIDEVHQYEMMGKEDAVVYLQ